MKLQVLTFLTCFLLQQSFVFSQSSEIEMKFKKISEMSLGTWEIDTEKSDISQTPFKSLYSKQTNTKLEVGIGSESKQVTTIETPEGQKINIDARSVVVYNKAKDECVRMVYNNLGFVTYNQLEILEDNKIKSIEPTENDGRGVSILTFDNDTTVLEFETVDKDGKVLMKGKIVYNKIE